MTKFFLPQKMLEEWALADKADIRDGKLDVPAEKASYPVTPAVHFLSVASGVDDAKLLEKVKTMEQLSSLGAEHQPTGGHVDSVILGEVAYEVAPGYLTEAKIAPPKGKSGNPETDLLAAFLLDKL